MTPPAADRPPTRRERTRAATTAEIHEVARRLLVEEGAGAVTLRAVAREMGMAPSALYRYVASRDDLLTVLIVQSYDAVGETVERASAALDPDGEPVASFLTVVGAFRRWALDNPHEYGLLYGTPVPGYAAPESTAPHAMRTSEVLLRMLRDAVGRGQVTLVADDDALDPGLREALGGLGKSEFAGFGPAAVALALECWTALLGAITAEVFGHLPDGLAEHREALFRDTMTRQVVSMGFPPPAR